VSPTFAATVSGVKVKPLCPTLITTVLAAAAVAIVARMKECIVFDVEMDGGESESFYILGFGNAKVKGNLQNYRTGVKFHNF